MLFLVFAGDNYYPSGGWDDFRSAHTTEEEANTARDTLAKIYDWTQVVDLAEELVGNVDTSAAGA